MRDANISASIGELNKKEEEENEDVIAHERAESCISREANFDSESITSSITTAFGGIPIPRVEEQDLGGSEERFDAIVVGAGVAGLGAALMLTQLGVRPLAVAEASDRPGGRVQDMAVEYQGGVAVVSAGAEFIHGSVANSFLELLHAEGLETVEARWPDYFYLGKEGRLVPAAQFADVMAVAESAIDSLKSAEFGVDETLLQYLARCGVSSRELDLVDATYANDWGGSMSELGAREVAHEQRRWKHGDSYLLLRDTTLASAVHRIAANLDIRYGVQAVSVDVDDCDNDASDDHYPVVLVSADQSTTWRAKAAVLALPVGALQNLQLPSTRPPPPAVAGALKCFAVLDRPCWPSGFWNAVCADCLFPEVWIATTPAKKPVLVGFVAGTRADRLAHLKKEDLRRRFLAQLDLLFGSSDNPRPASDHCLGFDIKDWRADPYTRAGYSKPAPGDIERRALFGQPIKDVIFLAGEALNPDLNPCLQGALDSGRAAANQAHAAISRGTLARAPN